MERFADISACVQWAADKPLPMLRHSKQSFDEIDVCSDVATTQLSNIILMDPGLIVTLMRHAGNLPRGHLHSDIHTVDNAVMLLGCVPLLKLLGELPLLEESVDETACHYYMEIVSRAYHSAYQAYGIARQHMDTAPDEIFTAAMLQEIGALVLWVHAPKLMQELANKAGHFYYEDSDAQFRVLGFTLDELSQALVSHWPLSHFIQNTFKAEESENVRLRTVVLGTRLGHCAEKGWDSPEMVTLIEELAHFVHKDPQTALSQIRDNAAQAVEETPFYGVESAATRLVKEMAAETEAQQAAQSRETGEPTFDMTSLANAPGINPELLKELIRKLEAQMASKPDLRSLMSLAMQALHEGVGLSRAVFTMFNRDRKTLVTRFVIGTDNPGFHNLAVPVNQHNLFNVLIHKPQSVWVREQNRGKIWPLMPPHLAKLIEVDSFYITTIQLRGKPVGILYADRFGHDAGLDETGYQCFRHVSQLIAKGLEKLSR